TRLTEPPTRAISPGFRKIPVPTMVPTTIAAAAHAPSARTRSSLSPGLDGVAMICPLAKH
ncbi:MAG: hypothetical protein WBX16_22480, partial [Candidatus Acidiferrales bacterium]